MKACGHPGCPHLVQRSGANRCPTHDPGPWGGPTRDQRRARTKTPEHQANRRAVKKRDANVCYLCGTIDPDGHADHITPIAEGGPDTVDNMAWICRPCHATKSGREGQRARGPA